MKGLAALLALGSVWTTSARADDAAKPENAVTDAAKAAENDAKEIEFTVPQTPAFDFLGASPSEVARPGTLRDLGVELGNAIDTDGRVKQGFAFEIRPTPLFGALAPTYKDAQATSLKYRLSRLHLSTATQKTTAGSDATMMTGNPTDVAFGLRWTIIDLADPWADTDYRKQIDKATAECVPKNPDDVLNAVDLESGEAPGRSGAPAVAPEIKVDAAIETRLKGLETTISALKEKSDDLVCISEKTKDLEDEYADKNWNKPRLEIGAAGGFRLSDSKLNSDAFWLGEQAWLTAGAGITDYDELDVSVRGSIRREDETGRSTKELAIGARLFVGTNRFHLYGELVGKLRKDSTGDDKDYDWGAGAEVRVMEKSWLAVGLGNQLDDEEDVQVLANLRWVYSDTERFKRPVRSKLEKEADTAADEAEAHKAKAGTSAPPTTLTNVAPAEQPGPSKPATPTTEPTSPTTSTPVTSVPQDTPSLP